MTVSRSWRCLRFSSSPEAADNPAATETDALSAWVTAMKGLFAVFSHFRAPQGCPRVERQFFEPSMMKSSSSSRAPSAQLAQDFVDMNISSLKPSLKQPQQQTTNHKLFAHAKPNWRSKISMPDWEANLGNHTGEQ